MPFEKLARDVVGVSFLRERVADDNCNSVFAVIADATIFISVGDSWNMTTTNALVVP